MPIGASAGQTIFSSAVNSLGLQGSIVSTGSNGTVSVGTTETVDAVLGTLTFTALAGHTYRVTQTGRGLSGSVSGDRFSVKFRYTIDGSTPTASSTLLDHDCTVYIPGIGGNFTSQYVHSALFVPGAATVKVVVSTTRVNGTGVATPIGSCQFWAEGL